MLEVTLVMPEGELWAGPAERVIAKTLDGDIGVLTGHTPVLGILADGSVVRISPADASEGEITAAVSGGFFSVADDRVSVLARQAVLGTKVDAAAVKAELEATLGGDQLPAHEESSEVAYLRAQLRAAGERV